ncbi:response regulator [Mesobacillus foraminis]|uniref:Two-component system response regulator YesN n=1 Tax=Mesobacillus foraminis TaxID=279826 RepID=A0A4R2BGA4_9BACI|nr:response regulator [Mesobacillus foraminis]TCN25402.1 two-component system response regulator YesN [Mesobacillus foraminis]
MPRKIRAIIVDDEARLRRGVERLVLSNEEEWEVAGSFSSGDECLTAIQEEEIPFDLLITDVKMPGMDGLTLIKRLKELSAFHAMVISGFDDFQFLQTAIREGASDYMIKPIDRDDFKSQLRKIKEKIHAEWNDSLRLEEIESKASQFTHVKQTQMLSEVTWKQDIDLSLLEWTKDFPNGEYVLMYVGLDNLLSKSKAFEKDDWNAWTFAIENMYEEMRGNLVRSSIHTWRWKGEDLSFWLLLHAQEGKGDLSIDEGGLQFADELRLNIKRYTPFTCSIAVSRKINDLALLPSLKDELLTYIQFRLLYGGNRIFSSEAINQLKMNKKGMDSKEAEHQINRIIYSLDSRNPEKTKNEIMGFLNRIQSLSSPEEIEHSLHLLGIQIINYMIKNNQGRAEFPLMKEVFGLTKKMVNLIELRNEVYEWVKKVLAIMEQKSETQSADPIEVAKRWIRDHLDQNITIQKIASEVYLNPTYFCEYFKSQTGETVLDYVTRIRMEKARMLLVSSNFKIYAISEMVGYTDTKYFTKLFKKQYGETPSKYKESILFEQH